jgi:hypothetical protein
MIMRKFKSLYLPAAIVLMGVGAAFASNNAKSSDDASEKGYYIDSSSGQCVESPKTCSTESGNICTWTDPATSTSHNLRQLDGTSCGDLLFEPVMP